MATHCQEEVVASANRIWRDGNCLVIAKDARLPARCVKCNAPALGGEIVRPGYWIPHWFVLPFALLYWFHPWQGGMDVAVFLSLFIICAAIVIKKTPVTYCLCPVHRAKRRRAWWTMTALFLGFTLAELVIFALINTDHPLFALYPIPVKVLGALLPVCALLSLLYGAVALRTVYSPSAPFGSRDGDNEKATLGGFCPEFLAEFPDYRNGLARYDNNVPAS